MTATDTALQKLYEDCVESCADSLYRVAYRLTGNRTLASELVSETYLSAWKSLPTLSDPQKMRSWMFSILRNQYSKLIRKESKAAKTTEQVYQLPSQDSSTNIAQQETVDAVQAAIARLDSKHRLPVLLVSMEGLSVDEAAVVLEVPRGTVLSRLHRGRQKLKQLLTISTTTKNITQNTPESTASGLESER